MPIWLSYLLLLTKFNLIGQLKHSLNEALTSIYLSTYLPIQQRVDKEEINKNTNDCERSLSFWKAVPKRGAQALPGAVEL